MTEGPPPESGLRQDGKVTAKTPRSRAPLQSLTQTLARWLYVAAPPAYRNGTRFFAWTMGIAQLLIGLTMLILPVKFDSPSYDAIRPHLTLYGVAVTVAGLSMLLWQVLPFERTRLPQLSLFMSAITFALFVQGFWQTQTWGPALSFGALAFGSGLLSAGAEPWLRRRRSTWFRAADPLALGIGFERAAMAGLLLLFQHQLNAPMYRQVGDHLPIWGLAMLLCSGLLFASQFSSFRRYDRVLMPLAALIIGSWTLEVGLRGNALASLVAGGALAVAIAARPWVPASWLAPPQHRIANRLVAASVLSLGTALVVAVLVLLRQTESAYQKRAELDLSTTAQVVAHDTASFVDTRLRQVTILSLDPEIRSFDPDQQLAFIRRIMQGDPSVSQISVIDASGVTVLRSTGEQPNIDRRTLLPGVARLLETHEPNWDVIDSPSQGVPVLAIRVPMLGPDGAFLGGFVSQWRLTTLTQQLGAIPVDRSARIIIVDEAGRVVVHPQPAMVGARQNLSQTPPITAARRGRAAPLVYRDDGRIWLSAPVVVPKLGWTVLVERPETEVLAPANQARGQALVFLLIMLAIATAGGILFARRFSRPVTELALAARLLGAGVEGVALPEASEDETGQLVRAFREMRDHLAARTRERERAEETLRDSEARYRGIVETAQEGIWIIDSQAQTTFVNAKLCDMLGYPANEIIGQPMLAFVEPSYRATAEENFDRWQQGTIQQEEFLFRRRQGTELWTLASANILIDQSGGFSGAMVMLTDVTARKRADEERVRLLALERETRAEVEALLTATASLGVQADPREVLKTLLEQAAKLLDATAAAYAIGRDGTLRVLDRWQNGTWLNQPYEVPIDASIFGHVWQSGRSYRSNQLGSDPRADRRLAAELNQESMVAAPLLGPDGERLGCVAAFNSRRPQGFSERDERMLQAICEHGAAVLRRAHDVDARLLAEQEAGRRRREAEALFEVADRLSTLTDPEEVLESVLEVMARVMSLDRVGIVTNEGDHGVSRGFFEHGSWLRPEVKASLPLDSSINGWVIKNRRPYYSHDLAMDPRFHKSVPVLLDVPLSSLLSVPVIGRDGSVLAILNLHGRDSGVPFSEDDLKLAEGAAHQAAVALERAKLMQALRLGEEQMRRQAYYDPLTGLPNRALFMDRLSHTLASHRRAHEQVAVLFLDLDSFKHVNDSLGHAAGDELLISVAERLTGWHRAGDTVARFGGDEFAIILEHIDLTSQATGIADRLIGELRRPHQFREREIVVTGSVGITLSRATGDSSAEDLLREADIALYRAKGAGKAQAVVFNSSMSIQAVERLELENDLRRALERGELRVHYQPIFALASDRIVGAEALLRWRHLRRNFLGPDAFLPLAEETGLILPIGRWLLREACIQAMEWQRHRTIDEPFRVSVNLSAREFEQPDLIEHIGQVLQETKLPAACLELELTESAVIQNPQTAFGTLAALRDLGVSVAIDDFGTGYSSLSYLQRLAVDVLKIDRSFISELGHDAGSAAIVQVVTGLAHARNMLVTAEGIETAQQLAQVRALHCDRGQGFYLARPMGRRAFGDLLRARSLVVSSRSEIAAAAGAGAMGPTPRQR